MNDDIDLIVRNSKALKRISQAYATLRSLGVNGFEIDELTKAAAKLGKQIEVQADAETAVRKP